MQDTSKILVSISDKPLSCSAAIDFVNAQEHGAVDLFAGRVRNHNLGRAVKAVSYDVFMPLLQQALFTIGTQALTKFGPDLRCYLAHFYGYLPVGGISVVIAAGSPHRDEAFQACRYMIETLKHEAPIWKLEHYVDGDGEWVKGHSLCRHH